MLRNLMGATYDTIGVNYSDLRKPDSRIEQTIGRALGSARTVLNVGAGAGSYEPSDRQVTALEPSAEMIRQRAASAASAVQGFAEDLPFDDKAFDGSMAILTIHHWADKERGLREMRRVTRGPVVLLTFDPFSRGFWLFDYIPELATLDQRQMPRMADYQAWLGPVEISAVPVPHDCSDGFLCAYWRRPSAYLDSRVRAAMSPFWALGDISEGLSKLARDLESGAWAQRYADLLDRDEFDLGYRLVVSK
ncbi:MAG: class I SAM-dependent methyltransferase [Pseudomonadota bacterium]